MEKFKFNEPEGDDPVEFLHRYRKALSKHFNGDLSKIFEYISNTPLLPGQKFADSAEWIKPTKVKRKTPAKPRKKTSVAK